MKQDLKVHQSQVEAPAPGPGFDESTKNIIHRHLSDVSNNITDEDIRNVKTDFEQDENRNKFEDENTAVLNNNNEIINEDDDMSPLWNIFS